MLFVFKAPEDPYPAGLLDCFEVYQQLVETEGRVAGLNEVGAAELKVALVGDSSGGNLAAALTLKAINNRQRTHSTHCTSLCPSCPCPRVAHCAVLACGACVQSFVCPQVFT